MLEKWVYLLNNLTVMKEKPKVLGEHVFDLLITAARYSAMTPSERHQYDKLMMTEQDYINAMEYAKELAAQEGREQQLLITLKGLLKAHISEDLIPGILAVTPEELAELRKKL